MQFLTNFLDNSMILFIWAVLGSTVGLLVELNTGSSSSVLFLPALKSGRRLLKVIIALANILVGAVFSYALSPLIMQYLHFESDKATMVFFLVGIAGLSIVRAYTMAVQNKDSIVDFFFKVVDLLRGGK